MLVVLAVAGCNRSPSSEPEKRSAIPPGPAGWAVRHGEEVGAPQLERRNEAGQPAAGAVNTGPEMRDSPSGRIRPQQR
jgi:hypothetical protein